MADFHWERLGRIVMLSATTGMGRFNSEYGEWYLIHCPG